MDYLEAIILGIIQGLTEFLPVSSSGHLVLGQELLGVSVPGVSFEVIVHLGTLLSVLVYFRRRILDLIQAAIGRGDKSDLKVIGFLIVGTIPAGLAGVLLKDLFERSFSSPIFVTCMLLVTAILLFISKFFKHGSKRINRPTSVAMGIGQALAIFPGISRSGSTIVAGLVSGVKPTDAAEFSFLLAIPAIGGAALLKADELLALPSALIGPYAVGAVAAFVFGLAAVYGVLSAIRRGRFEYFAYYCFAVGLIGLYLLW